jgi:hypothetical protein
LILQEEWQPEKLSQVLHLYFDTFHLSNRHGSGVEVAKALANILIRLEEIELTIEKVSAPSTKYRSELHSKQYWVRYYISANNLSE